MINFKVELIKLLSCMDAVFKLLHVEIARKATDGSGKKKKKLMQNLGYCPFEHKAGRAGAQAGVLGWAQADAGCANAGRAGVGHCPWARGTARERGAYRRELARRRVRGAQGAEARGHYSKRAARAARRPWRGLGVLLGQQAVHSVHSACFDPVSTQYCT